MQYTFLTGFQLKNEFIAGSGFKNKAKAHCKNQYGWFFRFYTSVYLGAILQKKQIV